MQRLMGAMVLVVVILAAIVAVGGYVYITSTGLRSQPDPGAFETRVARGLRSLAVPAHIRDFPNPVPVSDENVGKGMTHFASYCAVCHGNDGSGTGTAFGRGFYPKVPDMRLADTQNLTDGELFYIIENGVRFTGMPAFGSGTADPQGETLVWQLIHFIRKLPKLTPAELDEMKSMNPI